MFKTGQIFTHTVSRPWTSKTHGKGIEVVTYRAVVTEVFARRFEYANTERLSVADPLPETDGAHSCGGGMSNIYADSLVARGALKLEG